MSAVLMLVPFDFATVKTAVLVLVLPPTPLLLLLLLGWRLRRRRVGGWCFVVAIAGLWFSTTEAAGEWITRSLVSPPPAFDPAQFQTDDATAVLVLGGGVRAQVPEYGGAGPRHLTAERLAYGVWLARKLDLPLGFAGGIGWAATEQLESEASIVGRYAVEVHQTPLRWQEDRSRDTRENAANALPLLAASGIRQVILVTHDSHMRRALRAFDGAAGPLGMRIVPAPLGLRAKPYASLSDWYPSVDGLARTHYAIYEWLAWQMGR